MRSIKLICGILAVCSLSLLAGRADTFQLTDGQTLTGDVVSFNESGLILRLPEGKYADRTPWTKFSQDDLKKFSKNAKMAPLVEPFIEVSPEEKVKKTEVEIREIPRLDRPPRTSLISALLSSSVGLVCLLLVYAANIYAAFEVAVFRARPKVMICSLAAIPVLGFLAPIVFLAMPTHIEKTEEESPEVQAATAQSFSVPPPSGAEAPASAAEAQSSLRLSAAKAGGSTGSLPTTQVFQRGAFTFNRRFFETKFPGFFGVIRRDAEKDMVLLFKAARGQHVAQRITRIAANDIHIQVQKGAASEEVMIPFVEIQEIHLKHKDA
ncbi:MAG: hypothetical protein U1F98_07415 [Verrucomicrobiota bacterium]